ncbi:hypothetical protein [Mycoplasma seminis]|uniref:C4-dicarboxylate ABC transporter n=1 Tax=Mycoplasma seminis TaxID=512749 RepID=A0ABY9HA25_9MOLU|nr:hypothetical protein [Mycoplasma seminis]WLP85429.1 hypothetical protein Q8852_03850 [Mycoplasma seminis]
MQNIKEKLLATPLGVNGVALGTMGIATTGTFLLDYLKHATKWANMMYIQLALQVFCMCICVFYVVLTCIRYSLQPKTIWEEIKVPHVAGMVGVLFLCFCLLGNSLGWILTTFIQDKVLRHYLLILPTIIVVTAVTCQLIYLGFFLKFVLFKKEAWLGEAYASWFVPLVGLAISAAYVDDLGDIMPLYYWQAIWFLGFAIFLIMYPYVFYKFLFKPHSRSSDIPSMAIFASPANMMAVGFLVAFNPHRLEAPLAYSQTIFNNILFFQIISIILFCYGAVSVALYYAILVKSLMLKKYSMSWTSLTFPAAVSATGTIRFAEYFFHNETNAYTFEGVYWVLFAIGIFLFFTSLALVVFCNIKYAKIMNNIWFKGIVHKNKPAKKEEKIQEPLAFKDSWIIKI